MKSPVKFGILGAFIALAAALGVIGSSQFAAPADAQIPAGIAVVKACPGGTAINLNATTNCVVTITNQTGAAIVVPAPITLSVDSAQASPTGGFGAARLLNGGSGAVGADVNNVTVNNPNNGNSQTIVVGCFTGAAACTLAPGAAGAITINESLLGSVGGNVNETIRFGVLPANVAVAIFPSIQIGPATVTATITCGTTDLVAGSGARACTLTFRDNDLNPAAVSSANVTITVTGVAGVTLTATGTTTASFNCGGTLSAQSCTTVPFTINSATPNLTGQISFTVNYQPDLPQVDLPVVLQVPAVLNVIPNTTAAFRQPTGFIFSCLTGVAGPFINPIPGQIGAINVLAVGELPAGLQCQVQLASGAPLVAGTFAPGAFEVSSLQAGIQSAVGTLSTNIRIGCDNAATVTFANPVIDPNTCAGVTFRVFGTGVGFVEVRVRYEPSAVSIQAGIIDIEGSFNVAFVAPVVTVSLALSPNPVTVGSNSTATARFNRTINCQQAFGSAAAPLACIDPTTGAPIIFNLGSALNGSVVFNVDNTPVASFTDVTAAPPSPQTAGFITTANQVVRRCGFFPTAGLPANPITGVPGLGSSLLGGPLNGFFGGCETATANLRGNAPGIANVSATFIPDLPGAFGSSLVGLGTQVTGLLGIFGNAVNPTSARVLEVVGPAASGAVQLARGCNNVSPTVSETATAYAARVTPAAALVAIWEHQAATNTFRGFSPQAGAPNDLAGVTRLKPVFVCVSAAATLDQPPA